MIMCIQQVMWGGGNIIFHTYNINEILQILALNTFEIMLFRRNDRIDYLINNKQITGESVISSYDIIVKK